jgi:hypothetical protein
MLFSTNVFQSYLDAAFFAESLRGKEGKITYWKKLCFTILRNDGRNFGSLLSIRHKKLKHAADIPI